MAENNKTDLETGNTTSGGALYPSMQERPELRWAFIRKVYSIVAVQLLLTVAAAAVVVHEKPISVFFTTTHAGLALFIVLLITPIMLICALAYYNKTHPVNFVLLTLFTVTLAFVVGLSCSFQKEKVILEAVILTAVVVVSLTLYTFWAARRGQDFKFLGPFLFGSLLVLLVFGLIQICMPMGRLSRMIYGGLSAILFCGYIVYDTDYLIKRHTYDKYIWASVRLYTDIINLFMGIVTFGQGAQD